MAMEEPLVSDEEIDTFLKENYGYNPKLEDFMLDLMSATPMLMGFPMEIMRYRGVKKTQADKVAKAMNKVEGTYHEPFVGSGSSLYRVGRAGKFERALASDLNPKVIDFLETIKNQPAKVARKFKDLAEQMIKPGSTTKADIPFLKGLYEEVRSGNLSAADEAAHNLVLGNYSQMYMLGETPRFSPGNYIKPETMFNRIEEFGDVLQKVHLKHAPWQESMMHIKPGDFVNLDTPYLKTKTYPGLKPTTAQDHRFMSNILRDMAEETSGVMYNSPIGGALFDWMPTEPTGYVRGEEVVGTWGEGWLKDLMEEY